MSSGLLTRSKLITAIRCGTTEKVAMELLPKIFGFMTLPSVALGSGASFFVYMYGVILETE
jgi:hypothetical protein